MSLSFIQYGAEDIDDSLTLAECLQLGLSENETVDRDGRLWASQVGHCPRKGAIEATLKTKRVFSAASRVYCDIGVTAEELIIRAWDKRNRLLFSQYKLPTIREYPKLNMGGYVDAIAVQDGKIRAVEIKTCGELPSKPKHDHLSQVLLYSAVTGFPASLFYLSRSVADWSGILKTVQFDIPHDQTALEHHMYNAVLARLCIEKGFIPNKSSKLTKKSHCGLCTHIGFCWSDDVKTKANGSSLVIPDIHDMLPLANQALEITKKIMQPKSVLGRNNGILKHLSRHGTRAAKELLSGRTWLRAR